MEKLLESERLYFKNLSLDYLSSMYEICRNRNVMKYFPNILNLEETEEFLNKITSHKEKYGYSLMAVHLKEDDSFIGFIGLLTVTFDSDFTPCVEIGWRLSDDFWNKGYATEGAKAVLNYAFNILGLNEIYSFTATINRSSEKVMKKTGMKFIKNFNHPRVTSSPLVEHVLYGIKNKELSA